MQAGVFVEESAGEAEGFVNVAGLAGRYFRAAGVVVGFIDDVAKGVELAVDSQVGVGVDHVPDAAQVVGHRPHDGTVGVRIADPVDLLIREQLIDRVAPQVPVRQVSGNQVAGARLVELQDDLAIVVDIERLANGAAAQRAIRVEGPFDELVKRIILVVDRLGDLVRCVLERDVREPVAVVPGVRDENYTPESTSHKKPRTAATIVVAIFNPKRFQANSDSFGTYNTNGATVILRKMILRTTLIRQSKPDAASTINGTGPQNNQKVVSEYQP